MDEFTLSICNSSPQSCEQVLEPVTQSFDVWCEQFSKPQTGDKHGSYFVRGAATKRSNDELKSADVAILDGDSSIDPETGKVYEGAPTPLFVHEVLKDNDIQHFIYTSHSHGTKGNRFRVVVPVRLKNKSELAAVTDWLVDLCHADAVWLNNATENSTWSQPWYLPRVPAGSESSFEFYQHDTDEVIDVSSIMSEWEREAASQSLPPPATSEAILDPESPIGRYNAEHGTPDEIMALLAEQGYVYKHTSKINNEIAYRFLSPESSSGTPGLILFKTRKDIWRVYSHHDDIIGKKVDGEKKAHNAFSLFTLFHHGGDQSAALAALAAGSREYTVPVSDFSWTQDFVISTEQAEQFEDPDWAYPNLIVKGHLHAYPAVPNGGKTTVFTYLIAPELVKDGYEVYYVNADISGPDAKRMVKYADEHGFTLMLPDISGSSMAEVVEKLKAINEANLNCNNKVFIFDTLKKMTDVIQKQAAKGLYTLLRQLTAKGMTICLLAHTNKYKDKEGNPIYEGTGDLRSDVDNLIYLIPHKDKEAGTITVSTKPDKVRANFEPTTFEIDSNRNVSELDRYVDTAAESAMDKKREQNNQYIQAICKAIASGHVKQKDIIDYCKNEHNFSPRITRRVLDTYGKKDIKRVNNRLPYQSNSVVWSVTKGDKNAWLYETLPGHGEAAVLKIAKALKG